MALSQINNYSVGDNNFTSFQETLDATRRGMAEITLSNYDNDSAPVVKVGSVFENNGAFFQVTTSDITPTGYSGISNSTTFYLYFDESATAFIYSSTAPAWNDARQGWYNVDDRAFFSMYKDSGGTLYQSKRVLSSEINQRKRWKYYYSAETATQQEVYNAVSSWVPNVGDYMTVDGQYNTVGGDPRRVLSLYRTSSTTVQFDRIVANSFTITGGVFTSTGTNNVIDFEVGSHFDAIT